jgi:prepilin-type processing-associated H-X9-DG protein
MNNRVTRRKLRRSFEELRKDGILAEEAFACCTTCATSELAQMINEKKALGGVYWNCQDEDSFRHYGGVMIGFVDGSASGIEVAKRAVLEFERQGLSVRWNGSERAKIEILPKKDK